MQLVKPVQALSCLLLILAAAPALAQAYQWKDPAGRTMISDTPPPAGAGGRSVASPAPGRSDLADREMDFRKRRMEAERQANQAEARQARERSLCDWARSALTTLESGQPVSVTGQDGQPLAMDAATRQQEILRLQGVANEHCR